MLHIFLLAVAFRGIFAACPGLDEASLSGASDTHAANGSHTTAAPHSGHGGRRLSDWDYVIPQCWYVQYPACDGRQQSPINIDTEHLEHIGHVSLYPHIEPHVPQGLFASNYGHGLKVDGNFWDLNLQGSKYKVLQMHVHFPSEHAINGKLFAGELHIVHQKEDAVDNDDLLVVGLLFEFGAANTGLLTQLGLPSGAPATEGGQLQMADGLNLTKILSKELQGGFYRYDGSLTTPPCTESVKWFVLNTTQTVSYSQVAEFKRIYSDPANNRPLQLLNGRFISKDEFLGCPAPGEGHSPWDYVVPQCWPSQYPDCGGSRQSPVNIDTSKLAGLVGGEVLRDVVQYETVLEGSMQNNGHGLQVDGSFGNITVDGSVYAVLQFHVHFPSEHAVDGRLFAGEMHIVHQRLGSTGNNHLLVIALLFEFGSVNPFLMKLGLRPGATSEIGASMARFSLAAELGTQLEGGFYHYDGSLTTPPCSETVKWFVLDKRQTVSIEQVNAFKNLYPDPANNRPIQLLNGRPVVKSRTSTAGQNTEAEGCPVQQGDVHFEYVLPQCWEGIWPKCGGRAQSPVNIERQGHFAAVGDFVLAPFANYRLASGLRAQNDGHALKVTGTGMGSISMDGVVYEVAQFHIHCPSEHTLDGQQMACELHIVHVAQGPMGYQDLLVVGVMYELGAESSLLIRLGVPGDPLDVGGPSMAIRGNLNLAEEFERPLRSPFYRYDGSLTTPPCNETVKWFVLGQTLSLSQAQLTYFQQKVGKVLGNNRPVQLLNGRSIFKGALPGCEGEHSTRRLAGGAAWGYVLPQCWPKDYHDCGGSAQSPINIETTIEGSNARLQTSYVPVWGREVNNNGHGLQVDGPFGSITFAGQTYQAIQFHVHFPSEHAMDGKLFAGEMHLVHSGEHGSLLVVGIMLKEGTTNALLERMGLPTGAPASPSSPRRSISGSVDLSKALETQLAGSFFAYRGSLTTPPCSETVQWVVLEQPLEVSEAQVQAFKTMYGDPANNRPLQLLNGRNVVKDSEVIDALPSHETTTHEATGGGGHGGGQDNNHTDQTRLPCECIEVKHPTRGTVIASCRDHFNEQQKPWCYVDGHAVCNPPAQPSSVISDGAWRYCEQGEIVSGAESLTSAHLPFFLACFAPFLMKM
mmetsp:Transcript_62413/g.135506  ORF Transcript_62413/g.135506 Transcript_62413/m.135506 type:complete len:1139 (-) Transcript_62413:437-3853(-)|eukprot:CAMPEP_0170602856 /NCGR_PEP_ID=MMETSP0224-20130122/18611_1 /TAXON_ID=285029 /ORGANISM="Togula jolla, Strain CCCM 725" /LENGTH=1138 /DNA_ID=CAMNT_0010927717 /DNA_START=58 /DNA_END=3474 /DNA_ORIENTATION=+